MITLSHGAYALYIGAGLVMTNHLFISKYSDADRCVSVHSSPSSLIRRASILWRTPMPPAEKLPRDSIETVFSTA